MDPKSSTQEKSSRYTLRKKWARRVGFLLLALLTLEFAVYFGSNLFLAGMLRERLQESSNGVYEIGFNRLNFSLIRRGIFLDGITFPPQHPEKARPDQKLFEFTLDELAFTGLWFNFFKQEFHSALLIFSPGKKASVPPDFEKFVKFSLNPEGISFRPFNTIKSVFLIAFKVVSPFL